MNEDRLVSITEVANALGCDVEYIQGLINKGIVRPLQSQNDGFLFSEWAVAQFLQRHGIIHD